MNEKMTINVLLKKELEKVLLEFDIDEAKYSINLCDNDIEQIKTVFLALLKQIKYQSLELSLQNDESINDGESQLFIDVAKEYIIQLNKELLELEEDENLKIIRENYISQSTTDLIMEDIKKVEMDAISLQN